MESTNTLAAIIGAALVLANLIIGWLFAQTTVQHAHVNWEIIGGTIMIVLTLLGIAWKGGLLAGGQQNMIVELQALREEFVRTRAELHQLRNELQQVRDTSVVNKNDISHILAWKGELGQAFKLIEQEITRRNVPQTRGNDDRATYGR